MPHWINLSFYSTNKKIAYSNFVPRIKLPPALTEGDAKKISPKSKLLPEDEYIHNTFFDYDAYDAKIFQLPSVHHAPESRLVKNNRLGMGLLENIYLTYMLLIVLKRGQ